jgi:hypothetical protein
MNFESMQRLDDTAKELTVDGNVFPHHSWVLDEKGNSDGIVIIYGSTANSDDIIVFEYTLENLKTAELVGNTVYLKNSAGKDSVIKFKK